MIFARKIARSKWEPLRDGEIPADAITADLRTANNALSFWRFESENDIDDATLALASILTSAETFDVVWVNDPISASEFLIEATPGGTPVESLSDKHVDVGNLDLVRLGKLATLIRDAIQVGHCKRLVKKDVLELLASAVRKGTLELHRINEKARPEIARYMESHPD
jgi:hypothetical protein